MTPPPHDPSRELSGTFRESWHRFLDLYEPLRPELFRYCRYVTRSPWDAEDLAQDVLARAFATLGQMNEPPPNPRAWLFRVASNLWIDRSRQRRADKLDEHGDVDGAPASSVVHEPRVTREAAGTLIVRLSPQERVAVVLKDVFDLTLDEVAEVLSTTTGAVKAALHRGRGKLVEPEPPETRATTPAVLDAFCEAFNARDLDRLTALLLDNVTVEVVGVTTEYGPEAARRTVLNGMLYGSQRLAQAETRGGIEARFMHGILPASPRCEVRIHRGEPLLLLWYAHEDGEAVRAVNRVELDGDRIARFQNYFFNADFIADVCGELDVPFRVNGYRYWLTGC
jgi:RNA polymerase sigma-70 factor (ECF subfamily)